MKILIIEDEWHAYEHLQGLIQQMLPDVIIAEPIDTVQDAVNTISLTNDYDLIFMDIQLGDGLSFEIFSHIDIKTPVIFTTAYDQYALKAFSVNSIDYLLKPISPPLLRSAIHKFENYHAANGKPDYNSLSHLQREYKRPKSRCLIKKGGHYEYLDTTDIVWVDSEDGITFIYVVDGKRYMYNKTIESVIADFDPSQFFQINRSQVVNIRFIKEIHPYLNQRLLIKTSIGNDSSLVVSRQRVAAFKQWADS